MDGAKKTEREEIKKEIGNWKEKDKDRNMKYLLFLVLLVSVLNAVCNSSEGVRLLDIGNGDGSKQIANDEKERINTIIRAFKRLPDSELDRLGVQLDVAGDGGEYTAEFVEKLINAWNRRQVELKEVMKSIAKPVEFMERIMQGIFLFVIPLMVTYILTF